MYSDANPLPFNYLNLFSLETFRNDKEKDKDKDMIFFEKNKIANNYCDTSYTKSLNSPPHVNM